MKSTGIEYKARRWTDTNSNERNQPYDVVMIDYDNNNQHWQPGVTFSTEEAAIAHAEVLTQRAKTEKSSVEFVRLFWPIDGSAE